MLSPFHPLGYMLGHVGWTDVAASVVQGFASWTPSSISSDRLFVSSGPSPLVIPEELSDGDETSFVAMILAQAWGEPSRGVSADTYLSYCCQMTDLEQTEHETFNVGN